MVSCSDDWQFPTNKLPNIGWLGRVHRGTPWQTVYLKSPGNFNYSVWTNWSGGVGFATNLGQIATNLLHAFDFNNPDKYYVSDAAFSIPTNDWAIPELFTTAVNDNMTRGRLSINQTNLAAWSALLSGVTVLTNGDATSWTNIQPIGAYEPTAPDTWPALLKIVTGINSRRTNFVNGVFHDLGDVLSVPELTVKSPYLDLANSNSIPDWVYERIPQQTLGLLHCDSTPRFVVYSYGQTLKPADRSLVTGGPYFGLCTNYQITAEAATRAVIRLEGTDAKPRVVVEKFNVLSGE